MQHSMFFPFTVRRCRNSNATSCPVSSALLILVVEFAVHVISLLCKMALLSKQIRYSMFFPLRSYKSDSIFPLKNHQKKTVVYFCCETLNSIAQLRKSQCDATDAIHKNKFPEVLSNSSHSMNNNFSRRLLHSGIHIWPHHTIWLNLYSALQRNK